MVTDPIEKTPPAAPVVRFRPAHSEGLSQVFWRGITVSAILLSTCVSFADAREGRRFQITDLEPVPGSNPDWDGLINTIDNAIIVVLALLAAHYLIFGPNPQVQAERNQ